MLSTFEKAQADKIRSLYSNTEAVPFTETERTELFKSQFAKDVDTILFGFDELQKAQDNVDLEKSVGSAVHKYIKKVGERYFYEPERKITPFNDLRDYHSQKTSLDSIKTSLDGSAHSLAVRDMYKNYNQRAASFKEKYGHDHHGPEADHHLRMTVAGIMNHVHNSVIDNAAAREAAGGPATTEEYLAMNKSQSFTGISAYEKFQAARISATYGDSFEKSEGARGGHVIGHTKAGKAIYAKANMSYDEIHDHAHKVAKKGIDGTAQGDSGHVGVYYKNQKSRDEAHDKLKAHFGEHYHVEKESSNDNGEYHSVNISPKK
jgi:hypothetical protein